MFSYYYNYILFFFNYELIIPTCFFFFLFFVLISDQGQIGASLQELSIESKSKLVKHLALRETMIQDLSNYLDKSITQIKRISMSFEASSNDILSSLQYLIKKISINATISQVKFYQDILIYRTTLLSFEIKNYFVNDLFLEKSFKLSQKSKLKILA